MTPIEIAIPLMLWAKLLDPFNALLGLLTGAFIAKWKLWQRVLTGALAALVIASSAELVLSATRMTQPSDAMIALSLVFGTASAVIWMTVGFTLRGWWSRRRESKLVHHERRPPNA